MAFPHVVPRPWKGPTIDGSANLPPNDPGAYDPDDPQERERLEALGNLGILDTPPEAVFDGLAEVAALHYGTRVALITFVARERQWFKACYGWSTRQTERRLSFCAHAIRHDAPMVVPDAREDPRFRDNALVTGPPNIRFYAGAPLITSDGYALGTLCIIDGRPRPDLVDADLSVLERLAEVVVEQLELRLQNDQSHQLAKNAAALVEVAQEGLIAYDGDGRVLRANADAALLLGLDPDALARGDAHEHAARLLDADGLPLAAELYPALQVLATGDAVERAVYGLSVTGQAPRWLEMRARPIGPGGDRPDGAAMSLRPLEHD